MLIVKVFVNESEIDELLIHNRGEVKNKPGIYKYTLMNREGNDIFNVTHKRDEGWKPLVKKVIRALQSREKEYHKGFKTNLFEGENTGPVEPSTDDIIRIYKRLENRKERKIK